ncbi:MAG: hypothetical protein M0002_08110 [Rhodospirillales bacterium]|nr:hypothetical protein [Rhodospirillales bacterium]
MDRIDGANYALNGGLRQFQDQNLSIGQAGTEVTAAWMNDVQEELIGGLIAALGLAPTIGAQRQIQQALWRKFGGNLTTITATATLTADNAGLVLASASAGNVVLTLPAAAGAGGMAIPLTIVRTDASANSLTVVPQGTDQLQPGAQTTVGIGALGRLGLNGDGAGNWEIIGARALSAAALVTSSGSWVVPAGITLIRRALVWGAGGGGGASNNSQAASGGGSGALCLVLCQPVTPGQSITCMIGAGGASQPTLGAAGNNGSQTTMTVGSTVYTAGGGSGGTGGSTSQGGGAGAAATGGTLNIGGQQGATAGSSSLLGAGGGSAPQGGMGGQGASGTGSPGTFPGGGGAGSGGTGSAPGLAGANGAILLECEG